MRVPSMIRWPGNLQPGRTLNGIQGHQDMFTSLAAAAGIDDAAKKVMDEQSQYIDGVNNLPYWQGETDKSARDHIFYYFESQLTAVRMGPWKWHFATKEDYYDNMTPRNFPMVFNLRMDPFESYDSIDSYGHLAQKVSWQVQPMNVLIADHLQTLAKYPPVQGGATFDMSRLVEDFLAKGRQ